MFVWGFFIVHSFDLWRVDCCGRRKWNLSPMDFILCFAMKSLLHFHTFKFAFWIALFCFFPSSDLNSSPLHLLLSSFFLSDIWTLCNTKNTPSKKFPRSSFYPHCDGDSNLSETSFLNSHITKKTFLHGQSYKKTQVKTLYF